MLTSDDPLRCSNKLFCSDMPGDLLAIFFLREGDGNTENDPPCFGACTPLSGDQITFSKCSAPCARRRTHHLPSLGPCFLSGHGGHPAPFNLLL